MKTIKKISLMLVLALTAVALLTSCQSRAEKARLENERLANEKTRFEESQRELMTKLEKLGDDIDYRIDDLNNRLKDATGEMKDGLQESKDALTKEKAEIERVKRDIQNSTQETWDNVSRFTEEAYDKSKLKAEQIGKDIDDWFDK